MGIYDREYYRGEGTGPGWFGGVSPACNAIIVINVVVFLVQQVFRLDDPWVRNWLEASPEAIFHQGRVWQLLTATFLHADIWHLIGNMWFLWLVGREMEALYGSRDFTAFYLVAAVVSTLGWAAMQAFSPFRPFMLGASGAVMAVVTLYTLYYPRREILFFFIPMPMWVLLGIYMVLPLLSERQGGHVAWESHVAGFAFAFAFKHFDLRWSRLTSGRMRRPRLKIFSPVAFEQPRTRTPGQSRSSGEAVGAKVPSVAVLPEDQLDARLDEVLAKIAREGRTGLTDEEHRVLQEASRRARNRRSDRP
ncbi:rhomboid family intramembrane serine protease [Paludisphaera borealis]|uniref:Rhomboid protease GluP n=1 Tax=Paludisphaera borealis TaxID=1387353 RepID=A0A1U7CP87_9BACT|nr:rhomboid family intramembrane serine protease [Paludisphaera borealis]APW60755.1 Rhomboid protease GluP [Paludisphaera borealis]